MPAGPLHRPGQPCLTCHGASGPSDTELAYAGTIYDTPSGDVPSRGAVVHIVGADGVDHRLLTNCAGNFFVSTGEVEASFPARVSVETDVNETVMLSLMNRSGSCNDCHGSAPSRTSPGFVWVPGEAETSGDCR